MKSKNVEAIISKRISKKELNKLIQAVDEGDAFAMFTILVHNQEVLYMAMKRVIELLNPQILDGVSTTISSDMKDVSKVEVNMPKKSTVELGNERVGEALRRARGGAR